MSDGIKLVLSPALAIRSETILLGLIAVNALRAMAESVTTGVLVVMIDMAEPFKLDDATNDNGQSERHQEGLTV
jgi:hypothetical protein